MAVLIDEKTKVICQGFTGSQDELRGSKGDETAKPDMNCDTVWTQGVGW